MAKGKNVAVAYRPPKKAKQVSGNKMKIKKLSQLKKVNKEIAKMDKVNNKRYAREERVYKKARVLREQLGID